MVACETRFKVYQVVLDEPLRELYDALAVSALRDKIDVLFDDRYHVADGGRALA